MDKESKKIISLICYFIVVFLFLHLIDVLYFVIHPVYTYQSYLYEIISVVISKIEEENFQT